MSTAKQHSIHETLHTKKKGGIQANPEPQSHFKEEIKNSDQRDHGDEGMLDENENGGTRSTMEHYQRANMETAGSY